MASAACVITVCSCFSQNFKTHDPYFLVCNDVIKGYIQHTLNRFRHRGLKLDGAIGDFAEPL